VTVRGVDDHVVNGDIPYAVVLGQASSADPLYDGLKPSDVSVLSKESDVAGVTVTPTSGLVINEAGGTATFTVALTSQPPSPVTIQIRPPTPGHGVVDTPSLTFDAPNCDVPQSVTIRGVDDHVVTGDVAYSVLTGPTSSADPVYDGLKPPDVAVLS